MDVYVLVLILGVYAKMPWWFWVLFVIFALDQVRVVHKNSD